MHTINASYRSLSFLVNLNWDRIFYFVAIVAAMWIGSLIGTYGMH